MGAIERRHCGPSIAALLTNSDHVLNVSVPAPATTHTVSASSHIAPQQLLLYSPSHQGPILPDQKRKGLGDSWRTKPRKPLYPTPSLRLYLGGLNYVSCLPLPTLPSRTRMTAYLRIQLSIRWRASLAR